MVINSIIERHNKLTPLSETEIKIISTATRLFLNQGFSMTTHRQIAKESGFGLGTVTYHYRAKEDMLRILIEELMDYHLDVLENAVKETGDNLFSYAKEIAIQLTLCEIDKKAWDLYHSAYNHPPTYAYIKDWAIRKNYQLLGDKTPNLHEADYHKLENITSGIELAALSSPCDRYFTLEDKIRLTLDTMMKAYDISESERKKTIEKVLALDNEKIAKEMFLKFVKRLDNDI
ncbi:MAG: TetR/AcrR family transcriptional regulator [Ruminococcaceae bacterium]|nr:TetR/AcrR family transcriptional regulator [Oscillospiraceae bacterium]